MYRATIVYGAVDHIAITTKQHPLQQKLNRLQTLPAIKRRGLHSMELSPHRRVSLVSYSPSHTAVSSTGCEKKSDTFSTTSLKCHAHMLQNVIY